MNKFYIFVICISVFYLLLAMRLTSTMEGLIYRFRQYFIAHDRFSTFIRFFTLTLGIFALFFFASAGLLVIMLLIFLVYRGNVKNRERMYRNLAVSAGRTKLSGLVLRQRKVIKKLRTEIKELKTGRERIARR